MKRRIILSVNCNQDYAYYVPLVCWAWRYFNWEPILFYVGDRPDFIKLALEKECPYYLDQIDGIRETTISQVSRLYGANIVDNDDLVMMGDIDLIPLSNHWHSSIDSITVYNHDLTGFTEIPMCFVSAPAYLWKKIMHLTNVHADIIRDLEKCTNAKEEDFYKWWSVDQQILTARLNEYGKEKITFINRGQGSHGFARGRVDRGHGGWVLDQPELIDCHMQQQTHHKMEKVERLLFLLQKVWPNENFDWFIQYTEEYRKLTNHTA